MSNTGIILLGMILTRIYVLIIIGLFSFWPYTLEAMQQDNIHHYYGGVGVIAKQIPWTEVVGVWGIGSGAGRIDDFLGASRFRANASLFIGL